MATGFLICSEPINLNIFYDIFNYSGSFITVDNGYLNVYDDDISGSLITYTGYYYYQYSYLYPENYLGFGIVNTGENDITGIYCCSARSDGTGYYYWDRIYCSGVFLNTTTGSTGAISGYYNNNIFCSTGYYVCRFFSDGCGSNYSDAIPALGSVFEENLLFINICGCQYSNGRSSLIADGLNLNLLCDLNYCEPNFLFFSCSGLNFRSDGNGEFFFEEVINRNLHKVSIDWDFSKRTKQAYGFNKLNACGDTVFISTQKNCNIFYEIDTICETTLCIMEASNNKSLFIEDSCVPFLYFRNVGTAVLNINLDSGILCRDFFKKCQIYNKSNYCNSSISLYSNDSIFLTFNASNSGDEYYSEVCYPFGFFYEFKNVELVNPYGLYPVCCGFDSISCCFIPTFIYSDLCYLSIENNCVINTGYSYNYKKLLSFSENLCVDDSTLELSLVKNTGNEINEFVNINTNFDIVSSYGINKHKAKVCTNEILILDNCLENIISLGSCFQSKIDADHKFKVIYDVDFKFSKNYILNYLDNDCSGTNYDFKIVVNSSTGLYDITRSCLSAMNNSIELNNLDSAYINLSLCSETVIKDIWTSNIKRNNLYLPSAIDFKYCCCFALSKSNYKEIKQSSGFWGNNSGISIVDSGFCNYITLINIEDPEYQQYKSLNYCINLCTCKSTASSSSIQNKNLFETSDVFLLTYCGIECSYFYCDLEFKYTPIDSVFYKNTFYKMPSYMMNIDFYLSTCHEVIPFPVNALNFDKLKIITTFDVFDSNEKSELNINYSGFNFLINCECSNYINYKFPIIQCSNLSGYEYPAISISNDVKYKTQSNIAFEVNPLNEFNCDFYYGLNNFLLFVNSKLNNGIALDFLNCGTKQICDYEYNSNCYSFLMMDLLCENFCCFSGSTISGDWKRILEYVSFKDDFELISYKNNTGDGYNYVFPIVEKVCFSDTYTKNNNLNSITKELNGLLNYISTGFNYDGLSTQQILLTGQNGNTTGTGIINTSGASFFSSYNFNSINLTNADLTGSVKSRDIITSKKYSFTGAQPICIISNYPLLDISTPIVCNNLKQYSDNINENESSGIYYYLYDISNAANKPVKITAPDLTFITDMCWNDQNINSNPNSSNVAQIVNNLARIDLNINNFIYSNPYFLDLNSTKVLCINLVGGL